MTRRPFPIALVVGTLLLAVSLVMHAFPNLLHPILQFFPVSITGVINPPADDSAAQIATLQAEIITLSEENVFLRRDSLIVGDASYPKLLARVLYSDPDPARHAIRIALPHDHSVVSGAIVVAPGNTVIGTVERIGARSADILLIDDPTSTIAAQIGEVDGLLQGLGRGLLTMQFIPINDIPRVGDQISTSASGGRAPEGLLLGIIASVQSDPGNPFVDISVMPAVPLTQLKTVAILLGSDLL